MAVLVEALSVIVRADRLLEVYADDWEGFKADVPNKTLCADGELVRVGFMAPDDAKSFIAMLESRGLRYLVDGQTGDIAVFDQRQGPLDTCDWAEFGHIEIAGEGPQQLAAVRLKGSNLKMIVRPEGWEYKTSLSASHLFVALPEVEKKMKHLGSENGTEKYLNLETGKTFYIGRTERHDPHGGYGI